MGTRLRRTASGVDRGFTLIELLVVIVIIGILATIAIPTFLKQRRKGYDASIRADLRNFATLEETYFTDHGVYGATADISDYKPTTGVSVVVKSGAGSAAAFCLYGQHVSSSNVWYYESSNGGLLLTGDTC
jgi:prepilin-type N-terminal cleavage/methylation domain-containing protein